MNNDRVLITGANLVLPDEVLRGDLLINDRRIERIIPGRSGGTNPGHDHRSRDHQIIEAGGMFLLPGMIDLHSDAIEKEIAPRPQAYFPINPAFYELEKKVAASGITTIYHSLSLGGDGAVGTRKDAMVAEIIENITRNGRNRSMIRNLVHLRYEVTHLSGVALVKELLARRLIHLLSFMDHTPGQGQFTIPGTYEQYAMETHGLTGEKARSIAEKITARQKQVNTKALKELAASAKLQGVRLASHDDDTPGKVEAMLALGVTISEFPVNLETARYAKSKSTHVAVGAPNVVRDTSHGNNLKATAAIENGAADIICSDYYPPAMLAAVFKLAAAGMELPRAVRMVSLNPARALGLEQQYGSLEVGKQADLVLVELYRNHPFIRKTLVGGKPVYQADYQ
jgi:alpha-D-ribose 1-methylphosphonate 5-triphosphate diphosphatase